MECGFIAALTREKEECEMSGNAETQRIINEARAILAAAFKPATVRQVYYQLVSRRIVENSRSQHRAVSDALVDATRRGAIPGHWMKG